MASQSLTVTEVNILKHVGCGLGNKGIAKVVGISEQTVKNHMTRILSKLRARDRTHAVVLALSLGDLNLDELLSLNEQST